MFSSHLLLLLVISFVSSDFCPAGLYVFICIGLSVFAAKLAIMRKKLVSGDPLHRQCYLYLSTINEHRRYDYGPEFFPVSQIIANGSFGASTAPWLKSSG